ncbi:Lipoprotein [Rhodanobacter sp. Root179]|jgi:hypothetical protein|uniref:hypothetical protein n=1 Tax=Rhodanobacter sp. Root179 TaxID=1736482 RepID=UPI0006F49EF8|nr:hypothetical protein [Rhodanobacter sp. Root179]KRB52711.1 hypothetical protein ASD82_03245 [Rhodanobacter sp. Root179]
MNNLGLLPLCLVALVLASYYGYRRYLKARALLQSWADANSYRILHAKRRLLMPLGMFFTTSRSQVVYHVAVYDDSLKRIRSGWVRLGAYWTGAMDGDAIEVRWEHEH